MAAGWRSTADASPLGERQPDRQARAGAVAGPASVWRRYARLHDFGATRRSEKWWASRRPWLVARRRSARPSSFASAMTASSRAGSNPPWPMKSKMCQGPWRGALILGSHIQPIQVRRVRDHPRHMPSHWREAVGRRLRPRGIRPSLLAARQRGTDPSLGSGWQTVSNDAGESDARSATRVAVAGNGTVRATATAIRGDVRAECG